jgi:hypothetical protein
MRSTMSRGVLAALVATTLIVPATAGAAAPRPAPAPVAPAGGEPATPEDWARMGLQQVPKQTPTDAVLSGQAAPVGANPYTGLLPDPSTVDWAYWQQVAQARGEARASQQAAAATTPPLVYNEVEPPTVQGQNDSQGTAELVNGFGTGGRRNNPAAQLVGTLSPGSAPATVVPSVEDDGAIPLANVTGLGGGPGRSVTDATIGDGPHGSAGSGLGDFDYFKITGASAGQVLVADTDTPTSELDTVVALLSSSGALIAFNDQDGQSNDSLLTVTIPAPGDYYVLVLGFLNIPSDPFSSGSGNGAQSEGAYTLTLDLDIPHETDFYSFDLKAGDVVGATVNGAASELRLFDPSGRPLMGSQQDVTFIYLGNSPLPGGGRATLDHVARAPGRYALMVTGGAGPYEVTLEAHRPEERQERNEVQTLFVDFDGGQVNTGPLGGVGVVNMSPLASFLPRWGLTPADEDALIDAILATVEENVRSDLAQSGGNPRFAVRIRNSRDNADTFGQPNVSRLVVGGTIAETGIPTIGISQSIDPGNFGHEETALILLDILSDPAGPFGDPSLNTYIGPASDRIAFIGHAIGNIVAHEAGHFLGSWHVDQFDAAANLMDQGGNFPVMYQVGPDGVGGTADDTDVDFGDDVFNPNEGFTGLEETLIRTAFGLSKGRGFA